MSTTNLSIVTPDGTVYEGEADLVSVRSTRGN